jgi:hypothetical protein
VDQGGAKARLLLQGKKALGDAPDVIVALVPLNPDRKQFVRFSVATGKNGIAELARSHAPSASEAARSRSRKSRAVIRMERTLPRSADPRKSKGSVSAVRFNLPSGAGSFDIPDEWWHFADMERFRPSPGGYYPYRVRPENDIEVTSIREIEPPRRKAGVPMLKKSKMMPVLFAFQSPECALPATVRSLVPTASQSIMVSSALRFSSCWIYLPARSRLRADQVTIDVASRLPREIDFQTCWADVFCCLRVVNFVSWSRRNADAQPPQFRTQRSGYWWSYACRNAEGKRSAL